jgi:hypothetical protein
MNKLHTFNSFLNEFGPLAGSGNVDQLDTIKRDAMKKSEKGKTVYVVGGKYGTYKISKYYEEKNTYAAFHNGLAIPVDESLNERRVKFKGKTINDLYNIIKVSPDSLVFSGGIFYSIGDIEELRNDLKSKTIYLQTKDGDEVEKDVQDIEFIEIN